MNPVERLQAAVEKLEQLKADSTPGPWSVNVHHNAMHSAEFRAPGPWNGFLLVAAHVNDGDPELIVALHRTIDAQLSLLRHAEKFLGNVGHHTSSIAAPFIDDALALADAILGSVS